MKFEVGDKVVLINKKSSAINVTYRLNVGDLLVVRTLSEENLGTCYIVDLVIPIIGHPSSDWILGVDMISLQMYNSPLYESLR